MLQIYVTKHFKCKYLSHNIIISLALSVTMQSKQLSFQDYSQDYFQDDFQDDFPDAKSAADLM